MSRFYWGADYIQYDTHGLDEEMSGRFFDVLDKLRRIVKHTKGVPSVADVQENTIGGFRERALYLGSKPEYEIAGIQALGKSVVTAQAEIQGTWEATDREGRELLNYVAADSGVSTPISRQVRTANTEATVDRKSQFQWKQNLR